jgi:site-specific DNA-methyltransferase (adenine-specific)
MAQMEPESVHCVVTSPPYWGLRDYGVVGQLGLETTPEEYVANMVLVFREVRRVLRADGTLWLNLGDSYATGGGSIGRAPGGGDQGERFIRAGMIATQPNRMPIAGLKPKDLIGIPWRVAFALQADGWYLRSDIIWAKPNPMPESVTDRPTKSHEYLFLLSKSARYYFDQESVREPSQPSSIARMKSGWNGNERRDHPNGGHDNISKFIGTDRGMEKALAGRNLRSVWTVATMPYPGAHFATFPRKLVEPCIKAGCPEGGSVLDPFAGSGTTALVAQQLGRRAVLIDLSADYLGQVMVRNAQKPLGLV